MPDTIRIDRDDRGVATLWLTRAEKHNALSRPMMDELTRAAADLGADPAVRVVILAADGGSFCAGGDLGWMREQMAADDATRREGARALAGMLSALNLLPKPLIARVQGNAFGGGVGMMAVSDIVVAADTARFGLTEVRLGLIPATIGPYVLARMGEPAARRVFFLARLFDAGEAVDLNLVSRRVAAADLGLERLDLVPAVEEAQVVPHRAAHLGAHVDEEAHQLGGVRLRPRIAVQVEPSPLGEMIGRREDRLHRRADPAGSALAGLHDPRGLCARLRGHEPRVPRARRQSVRYTRARRRPLGHRAQLLLHERPAHAERARDLALALSRGHPPRDLGASCGP